MKPRPFPKSILFPGTEAWELWNADRTGEYTLAAEAPTPEEIPERVAEGQSEFAFPARSTTAASYWISTTDDALLRDAVHMRLEGQGIDARNGTGRCLDFMVAARQEGRSLVHAHVLRRGNPDEESIQLDYGAYSCSARNLALDPNRLTLWKELGQFVVAITRGPELTYSQVLSARETGDALIEEIQCILLRLQGENITEDLKGLDFWDEESDWEECKRLEHRLGLPVRRQPRPAPIPSSPASRIVPPTVELKRKEKLGWQRVRFAFVMILLCIAVAVGTLATLAILEQRATADVIEEVSAIEPRVKRVVQAKRRWENLRPAFDPTIFPLERFLQIAQCLPSTGVQLTRFEYAKGIILLRGEASNSTLAIQFGDRIRARDGLNDFDWGKPQLNILPTGSTEFVIEGQSQTLSEDAR